MVQRVTTNYNECYNKRQRMVQRVTTSGKLSECEWQRVTTSGNEWQGVKTSNKKWQWETANDSEW